TWRSSIKTSTFVPCEFFFFQAEDGIRDFHVTGVQTCALPICRAGRCRSTPGTPRASPPRSARGPAPPRRQTTVRAAACRAPRSRSEERRVGKGGRHGLGRQEGEKKKG